MEILVVVVVLNWNLKMLLKEMQECECILCVTVYMRSRKSRNSREEKNTLDKQQRVEWNQTILSFIRPPSLTLTLTLSLSFSYTLAQPVRSRCILWCKLRARQRVLRFIFCYCQSATWRQNEHFYQREVDVLCLLFPLTHPTTFLAFAFVFLQFPC